MRSDARRNYERLLTEAKLAFGKDGIDTSLDDIARSAGLGNATLYRHFPTRENLLEAVLRDSIEELGATAEKLMAVDPPGTALTTWVHAAVAHATTYRGLVDMLMHSLKNEASELNTACTSMQSAGERLLRRAQQAGDVRDDTSPSELFALIAAAAWATEHAPEEAGQVVTVLIDGLRPAPPR
ncbi:MULTISPECIES: helix-turn-helix domain-containing protein [unclassified Streptomyces]|uniref:TetR/AcrR family transcriptional regulator n=1 Tax=unclassified Streptomyces TaxID=2593676 RepID=UPI00093D7303|nr:helix-turn-helix domain-containing protein [Streptomyces sp. TSRI0107]OKJ89597.1 TetR family transcriptional regulator [Streptomyces sp. TSRI0107]